MKLNPDCMRDIMLQIEALPFGKTLGFANLCKQLSQYTEDELTYTCIKLKEAELITAIILEADYFTRIYCLNDLTYDGHQFLADIRSQNIWNKTKDVASKVGSMSASAIMQIASGIVSSVIKNELGLM